MQSSPRIKAGAAVIALTALAWPLACGSFDEASPASPPDAAPDDDRASVDANPPNNGGEAADGATPEMPCARAVHRFTDTFSDPALPGWRQALAGDGTIDVTAGTLPGATPPYLHAWIYSETVLERPAMLSREFAVVVAGARLEFDLTIQTLDPYAQIGCSLGLVKQSPPREQRLYLHTARDRSFGDQLFVDQTEFREPGVVEPGSTLGLGSRPALTKMRIGLGWTRSPVGELEATASIDGTAFPITQVTALTTFDGVAVHCGVLSVQTFVGPVTAEVAIDNLSIALCPE
jgi:hypothetical protein